MEKIALIVFLFLLSKIDDPPQKDVKFGDSNATICVEVDNSIPVDSLRLFLYNSYFIDRNMIDEQPEAMETLVARKTERKFVFRIFLKDDIQYFSIYRNSGKWPEGESNLLDLYLVERGDSISIKFNSYETTFSGKGSSKCAFKYFSDRDINRLQNALFGFQDDLLSKKAHTGEISSSQYAYRSQIWGFEKADSLIAIQIQNLENFKNTITPLAVEVLKADLIAQSFFKTLYMVVLNEGSYKFDKAFLAAYRKHIQWPNSISEKALGISAYFVTNYLTYRIYVDQSINNKSSFEEIRNYKAANFRDKWIAYKIVGAYSKLKNADSIVNIGLELCKNNYYKSLIENFHRKSKVGSAEVYDLTFYDEGENFVPLSDFKGKVIFMDYWYVGCSPCIKYFKETVSKVEEKYSDNPDVVFLSICITDNKNMFIEGVKSGKYTSTHAINVYTGPQEYTHPSVKRFNIKGCPRPILIGKDGKPFILNENQLGRSGDLNVNGNILELANSVERALEK